MTASQCLCLCRYLGLMIGDLIPRGNKYWKLYLFLHEIVLLTTSPDIQKECHILLKNVIEEHHELYVELFNTTLKPKHHHMIYYPRVMKLIGPLVHCWSMRFESKHKELKGFANSTASRVNITYSLALKHQLKFSDRLLSSRGIELNNIVLGPTSPINEFHDINFVPVSFTKCTYISKWVIIDGIELKKDVVVIVDVKYEVPLFGSVLNIITDGCNVGFLIKLYDTLFYDSHNCAYVVSEAGEKKFVFHKELYSHVITFIVTMADGKLYVPLRFSI
jgi:hypothetical protein